MLFGWWKATLTLPILTLMSASVPPFNDAPKVCKALHPLQHFTFQRDGGFPDCTDLQDITLSPVDVKARLAEVSATVLVFSCICCWVFERRTRSSAMSRSSNCVQSVHWMPLHLWAGNVFMTQSIVRRNMKGDSKHLCLAPVRIQNASVSCRQCTTLQVTPSWSSW